jgi:hypothetical protein
MRNFVAQVGALRVAMAALTVLCALAVMVDPGEQIGGWRFLPGYVAPTLALLIAWVLPWDILMAKIALCGKQPPEHRRYRLIRALNIALLVLLVVSWGPFFVRLVNGSLN